MSSQRIKFNLFLLVLLSALFVELSIAELTEKSEQSRLTEDTVHADAFRRQKVEPAMAAYIRTLDQPGENLALYWLETDFGKERMETVWGAETLADFRQKWKNHPDYPEYRKWCSAIYDDAKCFPVPKFIEKRAGVTFEDSWMYERNYGGKSGHEGCDIMAGENIRGYYPVLSMTDGTVTQKGWLPKGGYRIGVMSDHAVYFYYAHLDSYADLEEGDRVKSGELLGFMGDSGYGETEGTVGKFPVHLHIGIYLCEGTEEISVNPYALLHYLEDKKIKIW
ncbi:M23 family metallopeptidase [Hespellia stercorisuis]|uniref:Peptidase family M23 n=1 Tax=Hespellia stercorisuis DSM 15480 TaxID=1121950 RepID=A0A1M6S254_9FIRM|nr:M23 family metallopeptidase [Hespellia stercorisuis]SHK38914.1 Peptidase family M23 [Hespellia stercorisuis DSM 15480]